MGPKAAALTPSRAMAEVGTYGGEDTQLLKWRFNPFSHLCCSCVMGKLC